MRMPVIEVANFKQTLLGEVWDDPFAHAPRNTLFGLYSILEAIPSKDPILKPMQIKE